MATAMTKAARVRVRVLSVALALALGAAWLMILVPDRVAGVLTPPDRPQETVIFVVMDTVRADHTSLCGYSRPTTPTLVSLAATGLSSCDGVVPGSWTVPSHASFFTGLEVPVHHVHIATQENAVGDDNAVEDGFIAPLGEQFPTLAEDFLARGYQTVGVSANRNLTVASGLTRGFEDWTVTGKVAGGPGVAVLDQLQAALGRTDRRRPLFLFVNIVDAHDPWFGVPDGLDWVAPREGTLEYYQDLVHGEWETYVRGELSDVEERDLRERVTDLYDSAVHDADTALGRVLDMLRDRAWLGDGARIVVISDHGEFMGEHQLLQHGRYLWEPNMRVPLVATTVGGTRDDRVLPSPFNALLVTELVKTGEVEPRLPVRSVGYPDVFWQDHSNHRVGENLSVGWWESGQKWLWVDGVVTRYDVASDPEERHPLPPGETPVGFDDWVTEAVADRVVAGDVDEEMMEGLRAMGYVDGP